MGSHLDPKSADKLDALKQAVGCTPGGAVPGRSRRAVQWGIEAAGCLSPGLLPRPWRRMVWFLFGEVPSHPLGFLGFLGFLEVLLG